MRKNSLSEQTLRKKFKVIKICDQIIIFRNPNDILFGTAQFDREGNTITITGIPKRKNNNGRIKIAKIIKNGKINLSGILEDLKNE